MRESVKLPFSNSTVRRIVSAAFPGAKTRRPVQVDCRESYHVSDYWDGGSRTYSGFVQLGTMHAVSSEALPKAARQVMGNPFNLPIGDVTIQPGFAVVEHCIFRGKDLGYRIIVNANDVPGYLPEASAAIPAPRLPDADSMPQLPESTESIPPTLKNDQ